jgi:hypothetical protein
MPDLDDQIARLELRAEQVAIHLQELARNTPDRVRARSELEVMLQQLSELKAERTRREALRQWETAA